MGQHHFKPRRFATGSRYRSIQNALEKKIALLRMARFTCASATVHGQGKNEGTNAACHAQEGNPQAIAAQSALDSRRTKTAMHGAGQGFQRMNEDGRTSCGRILQSGSGPIHNAVLYRHFRPPGRAQT